MSWQAYVDSNLLGTGKIVKAAIHGHDGSVWATSSGFNVKADEAKALAAAYKDATAIRAKGLMLGGEKYIALRADDRSVYGKKGSGGVITVKTKQAIIVGVYNDKAQPGEAAKIVEGLADYLISVSY